MKITLILIILNHSIFGGLLKEQKAIIQYYGSQVGIEFEIKVKRVRDKKCDKIKTLNTLEPYLKCLEDNYTRKLKQGELTHFVTHSTKAGQNFGISRFCSHMSGERKRASVGTYNFFSQMYSLVVASHEIFHQLCATDNSLNFNLMHFNAGGLAVASGELPSMFNVTINEIKENL